MNIAFKFEDKEFPRGKTEIQKLIVELGPIKHEEKIVLSVFIKTALYWISRSFLLKKILPGIEDIIFAMIGGITLFTLGAGKKGKRIINWKEAVQMP